MESKSGLGMRTGFIYSEILKKSSKQHRSILSPPVDPSITNIPRGNSVSIVQSPRIVDIQEEVKVNFEYDMESPPIPASPRSVQPPCQGAGESDF